MSPTAGRSPPSAVHVHGQGTGEQFAQLFKTFGAVRWTRVEVAMNAHALAGEAAHQVVVAHLGTPPTFTVSFGVITSTVEAFHSPLNGVAPEPLIPPPTGWFRLGLVLDWTSGVDLTLTLDGANVAHRKVTETVTPGLVLDVGYYASVPSTAPGAATEIDLDDLTVETKP